MYGERIEEPDDELRALFDQALELDEAARAAFVAERTAGRPELAAALTRLLAHHRELGDFLGRPWSAGPREAGVPAGSLLAPGERLGAYTVLGLLGRGGGGQVYRARQETLGGRLVALKVVATAGMGATDRERFLRGARMAAEVHHPHLAQVFDSGEEPERGLLFYSMRLIEGPDLQQLLERRAGRPLVEPGARRELVARLHEVAEALAALHARRLIHQDVKPGNVVVEGATAERPFAGRAVLVDFGLVKSVGSPAPISTVWATLPYAAPEVLLNRQADARSDVYAFGLCVYDLLAGCLPSERSGSGEDLAPLSRRCAGLEPDLEAVVHRALELTPERRYAQAGLLAQDLGAWLTGRPVRARRLTRVERARRWVRAHAEYVLRWGVRAAAGLVVLSLSALALARASDWRMTAKELEAAHGRGDLVAMERIAPALPELARELFLSEATGAALSELTTHDAPLERVARACRELGASAGEQLAAEFLGRDGLAARPELARFLLDRMNAARRDTGEAHQSALRTAALLFHDHPAEDAAGFRSAAPFRERFAAELGCAGARSTELDPARLFALTGLATTGGPGEIDAILAFLEQEPLPGTEVVRLGCAALEVLLRRSHGCGFAPEALARDWDGLLARLCTRAASAEPTRSPIYGMPAALMDLIGYVALARRRLGLAALHGHPCPGPEGPSLRFRAMNGDEEVLRLLSDPTFVADSGPHPWYGWVHELGLMLGCFEEVPQRDGAFACVQAVIRAQQWIEQPHLRLGMDHTSREWSTWPERHRPDVDTRVGWRLDPPLVHAESTDRRNALPNVRRPQGVAGWWFGHDGPHLWGQARSITSVGTPLWPDEEGLSFARLGHPGYSEVRLRFTHEWSANKLALKILLDFQQGYRALLPHGGSATAVLELPGGSQARLEAAVGATFAAHPLSVRHEPPGGEYEVVIRLDPGSTTTLRLYEVLIQVE